MKLKILLTIFLITLAIYTGRSYSSRNAGVTADNSGNTQTVKTVVKEAVNEEVPEPALPTHLIIPKLNINAEVEVVGKDAGGKMDVPKDDFNVGWWKFGSIPGQVGSAVLAGHYDTKSGGPAIFYLLDTLDIEDEIQVVDKEGNKKRFIVTAKETFKDATFPLDEVFARSDGKYLNLITCEGTFDRLTQNYSDRLVIFSELIEE